MKKTLFQKYKDFKANISNFEKSRILKVRYKEVISLENLKVSFNSLKSKEIKVLFGNKKKIEDLYKDLKLKRYRFESNQKGLTPKSNNKVFLQKEAILNDLIVLGALLQKLKPVLAKRFSEISNCVQSGQSNYGIFKKIKQKWPVTTWIVNIDIMESFEEIHYYLLIEHLRIYCDIGTIELIEKIFPTKYYNHDQIKGLPCSGLKEIQKSFMLPVLRNFWVYELNEFLRWLCKECSYEFKESLLNGYQQQYNLVKPNTSTLKKTFKFSEYLKEIKNRRLAWRQKNFCSHYNYSKTFQFRRLHCLRDADNFILGYHGTKREIAAIKQSIDLFLKSIYIELKNKKTRIFHFRNQRIEYLGMSITNKKKTKLSYVSFFRIPYNNVQLQIPINLIFQLLSDRGFLKFRQNKSVQSISTFSLARANNFDLTQYYSLLIKEILSFYSCANQRSTLWIVCSILQRSFLLTLACKHKFKFTTTMFRHLSFNFTISDANQIFLYPRSLKTITHFKL